MARGANNTRNPKESRFPELLETILKQTSIPRIRISSIGPEYANDHFFELLQDIRVLPHFHYSIQSFSDKVLKLMKRNYDNTLLNTVLKKTRQLAPARGYNSPPISIGADIIVGFPGETEIDFLETVKGVEKHEITKLHIFPFSDHHKGETIPASLYPNQVEQTIKKERERKLLAVGETIRNEFIKKNKGIPHNILLEERKQGKWRGRTENYIQVEIEGEYKKGEIIEYVL
jgi:tRNA A37 methylthiotransferase MiaB